MKSTSEIPAPMEPSAAIVADRLNRAAVTIADCFRHLSPADRHTYLQSLVDSVLPPAEPTTGIFSCDDPAIQEQAHLLLTRLTPNLELMRLPEFVGLFAEILKLATEAHHAGRTLTADFLARLVAAFEGERTRRGFKSYADMAETAVSVHAANMRGLAEDRKVH